MFGLTDTELSQLKSVLLTYKGVEKAILYGSRARGTNQPYSDIDIALVGASLSLPDLAKLDAQIDDLYLPYMVDINAIHRIKNPALLRNIAREGVEII